MILRNIFIFIFVFISLNCNGQNQFEKGYFIDKEGNKTECFIKNMRSKNCPEKFVIRLTKYGKSTKIEPKDVSEIGLDEGIKFYSLTVLADLTKMNTAKFHTERKRDLKQKTLFFIPLVIGEVSLFQYKVSAISIFFVQKGDDIPKQLIQRAFGKESQYKDHVEKSEYYREIYLNALWDEFRCGNITAEQMLEVDYKRKDLTNYFVGYNTCKQYKFENVAPIRKKKRKINHY